MSITQGCFCLLIFFKHYSYFDAFWGKINIPLSQVIFSSFYIGFIVNFNVTCGHYCNWHVLNIIWNKKTCQGVHSKRQHLDDPYVVRAMHVGSSSHETPPFKLVFRRSRHLLYDGVAHGLEVPLVWRRYLFFFFSCSFFSPSQIQCNSLQKFRPTPSISFSFSFGRCHLDYYFFLPCTSH